MKICLVSDQYETRASGIGVHANNMVNGLLERNHEVVLMCSDIKKRQNSDFTYIHIPTSRLDPSANRWFTLAINLNKKITDLYAKYKFNVFHCLDARQGGLASKKLTVPTIGSVNDYYYAESRWDIKYFYEEYKADWVGRLLYYNLCRIYERNTYGNFDMLVANSKTTHNGIISSYNLDSSKVRLIYKALPCFPKTANKIISKENGDYNILMVGFGLQRKGIYYLIDAAPKILLKYPRATFHIIGKELKPMTDRCKKIGVSNNFKFYGVLEYDKIEAHYRDADIFVMPSIVEGLGVAMIEAMSHGIPSIGTRGTGLEDIVEHEKNGYLIPPKSSFEIEKAILYLLSNVGIRKIFSEKSLEKSRQFNAKKQLDDYIKLYTEMLEMQKRGS